MAGAAPSYAAGSFQDCLDQAIDHNGEPPTCTKVNGVWVASWPDDSTAGFGGTFALKNPDVSAAMLADKMRNVLSTHAELCSAGDSSCLMHIGGGLSRLRTGVRTVHLAEILASTEDRPGSAARGAT